MYHKIAAKILNSFVKNKQNEKKINEQSIFHSNLLADWGFCPIFATLQHKLNG